MPSFADSFWTPDYSTGIDLLFTKLYQGCVENDEFIALFATRAEYESQYGKKLALIPSQHEPNALGFAKDAGASLRSSFEGLTSILGKEGEYHFQVAENIKIMVLDPFGKWSAEHKQRIQYSEKIIKGKLRDYNKHKAKSEKSQKKYFNKCRLLEDVRSNFKSEKDLLNFINDQPEISKNTLGDFEYDDDRMKEIIKKMLLEIPRKSYKVTLLGTYQNCSSGASIAQWLQTNLGASKIEQLEKMGQDLLESGYLRLVGSVGKTFLNSSQMYYQWRPYSFEYADVADDSVDKSKANLTTYFDDIMSNVTKIDVNDKITVKKLYKEVEDLDHEYLQDVLSLDELRCQFEEVIIDHYSFLEKCELDRLKALKKVTLDFVASISNKIGLLKSTVDELMICEESIQPVKDLKFLLENYRTGYYQPKVALYDNFYQSTLKQIFGVDITIRCRFDKRAVPIIVSSILMYMDSVYPILEDDEIRLNCWITPVKLQITHEVRAKLNALALGDQHDYSIKTMHKIYEDYKSPSVVASVLKLYLLELPDSLIPSEYFDLIKSLYQQYTGVDEQSKRTNGLTSFLSNLPTANVATLDSILTHFTRMIAAVDADNKGNKQEMIDNFVHNLSNEFSTIILRSNSGSHTCNTFATKLLTDLLQHKTKIFDELKAQQHQKSISRQSRKNLPKLPASSSSSSSSPSSKNSTVQSRLQNAVVNGKKRVTSTESSEGGGSSSSTIHTQLKSNNDGDQQETPTTSNSDRNSLNEEVDDANTTVDNPIVIDE